jgi:hypothetical protein
MASTFSPTLRIELIGDGDQSGIWGQTTNTNLGTLLEQAITGVVSITMTDANYTLSNFNGVSDEARNSVLVVGGTNAAVRDVIAPLVEKLYVVKNSTVGGFAINIRAASGSSVSVPSGATVWVYCDGTNFNAINTESVGNFEVNGNLTVTGNTNAVAATYTGNVVALNYSTAGNVSATNFIGSGLTLTAINASNISAGTIANARTTAATANGASTIVLRDSNGSFAGNVGTFTTISGDASAVSNINASNISSGTVASARIAGSYTGITGVGNVTTGTWSANAVSAEYGGTGRTSLTANNVILGNGTSSVNFVAPGTTGNVLTSNGTTWASTTLAPEFSSGTRMTFNQTNAPTGWTKDTSTDNAGFRLVSGSVSTGGSVDFTTAFSASTAVTVTSISSSVGATTLSTPQIPSHTHTFLTNDQYPYCFNPIQRPVSGNTHEGIIGNVNYTTNATGGGGSHNHPFSFSSGAGTVNLAIKYVDLIIAQKN